MIDTATPEQALIGWQIRSDQRDWWIELVGTARIKLTMQQREVGGAGKFVRVYHDVQLHDDNTVVNPHDITDLIKRGLAEWLKKYRTLA